jgi:hypothetical protein
MGGVSEGGNTSAIVCSAIRRYGRSDAGDEAIVWATIWPGPDKYPLLLNIPKTAPAKKPIFPVTNILPSVYQADCCKIPETRANVYGPDIRIRFNSGIMVAHALLSFRIIRVNAGLCFVPCSLRVKPDGFSPDIEGSAMGSPVITGTKTGDAVYPDHYTVR